MSFRDDGQATLEWVARYLENRRELPVLSRVAPGAIRAQLPEKAPETGEPFSAVLADLDAILLPGITHWNHPRFFAYFSITASEPGILAELLIAALNQNAMLWRTSPAATELEQVTLSWLADLLGLPASWNGHIEDGASTSTLAALATARHVAPAGRTVVYCSEHAHSSVDKACRLLGLELRKVGSDSEFRMQADLLGDLSDAVAVVATVGTTSTTSVDPVPAIADRCASAGVWLHIDASYAGSAAVCEEHRWALAGCERADSLVVNPHKWLFTPMDCSTLWTRRPAALQAAFSAHGDYLAPSDGALDLRDYGPALGRRFRALKLWTVLRCHGRDGLQALIRRHVELAARFERWVDDDSAWEVAAPRLLSTVCFRHRSLDNDELARAATATGRVYVATTRLAGRSVIRLAIGNAGTQEEDVQVAWEVLRECAR